MADVDQFPYKHLPLPSAALQGNLRSQAQLGMRLGLGRGVPQDYGQSYVWLSLAVAGGDRNAKELMEKMRGLLSPPQLAAAQARASELFKQIEQNQKSE